MLQLDIQAGVLQLLIYSIYTLHFREYNPGRSVGMQQSFREGFKLQESIFLEALTCIFLSP